ncbi:organic solvent tolerance protein [Croceicoccus estronivorus]|uniref:LPS-assembly protein LptD n=1 Tax=Croceicoccus estronivorus TaxID=1172626 RepID=UPI0008339625|nr:organic solvent tolerance protein [Croceicoccus estronivorus]
MLPDAAPLLQAPIRRLHHTRSALSLALLVPFALPGQAHAQDAEQAQGTQEQREIAFEANQLDYDSDADILTASGDVILRTDGQTLEAQNVIWNRKTGQITASGNIRLSDEDGNQLFSDSLELTDELKAGAMQNMLLAFAEGGRLAAREGTRGEDGAIVLRDTAYSGCPVTGPNGCDRKPSWRVIANRVVYDPDEKRVRFYGARLEVFGMPLVPLPGLAVNTDGRARSGLMIPGISVSRNNGLELSASYYARLSDNRDLELTAYAFSEAPPMGKVRYRALWDNGAYQFTGYATRSERIPLSNTVPEKDWRGYLEGNGRFQFDPNWSLTYSARVASDRTFLRRYDISRDDRLRSTVDLERIGENTYFSLSGWATQTLRTGDDQGQVPIALPILEYRHRLTPPLLGGKVELQVNSLAISRTSGQDTQRAFALARWDLRRITGMGQVISLTALARGDAYHSSDNDLTDTSIYRGLPGWQTRGIAIGAIDVKWPFLGPAFGGTQVFTPRIQLVASPKVRNLDVPNEDARAIDLEDSNLFALNRFPGYDRVEDGVRFTYGFDWQLDRPGWRIKTTIGQSYRLTNEAEILPEGTGLSGRFSDYVGRTEIRFREFLTLTHRFRLDKDNFGIRRNEVAAAVGTRKTYAEVSYLRLNRNIQDLEDLQDREELRVAGRIAIADYWSIFGSGVINLTDRKEDPTAQSDGFEPLRTRVGIAYQDECMEFGLTWRHDYVDTGDARAGNRFQVYFALRNIGVQ